MPLLWLLVVSGNLSCYLPCGSITPTLPSSSPGVLPMSVSLCPNPPFYKDTSHIGLGPTPITSF